MARMIDGDVVTERLRGWLESPHGENVYNSGYDDAIRHVLDVIDHTPTLTQPNEPLTLEKLENMEDTTPVWWDQINSWVLVYKGNLTTWSGKHLYAKGCNGKFYRRPPEKGEKDGTD